MKKYAKAKKDSQKMLVKNLKHWFKCRQQFKKFSRLDYLKRGVCAILT